MKTLSKPGSTLSTCANHLAAVGLALTWRECGAQPGCRDGGRVGPGRNDRAVPHDRGGLRGAWLPRRADGRLAPGPATTSTALPRLDRHTRAAHLRRDRWHRASDQGGPRMKSTIADLDAIRAEDTSTAPDSEVLTVDEGARFLKIGRNALYDVIGRGEVPHQRIGKTIRISRSQLVRWLAGSCEVAAKGSFYPPTATRELDAGVAGKVRCCRADDASGSPEPQRPTPRKPPRMPKGTHRTRHEP